MEQTASKQVLSNRERAETALLEAQGNKSRAAAALNITRKTLYRWLRDDA